MHYLVSLIMLTFAAAPLLAKLQAAPAAKKDSTASRGATVKLFLSQF